MNINQYTRYQSKDGKRMFIVLGLFMRGFNPVGYEVLDVYAEQCKQVPYETFHQEITIGNLVKIKQP